MNLNVGDELGGAAVKLNVKMCLWSEIRSKKRRELRRIEEGKFKKVRKSGAQRQKERREREREEREEVAEPTEVRSTLTERRAE